MLACRGFVDLAGLGDLVDALLQRLLAKQADDLDPAVIAHRRSHPRPSTIMCTHGSVIATVGQFANCPLLEFPRRRPFASPSRIRSIDLQ